MSQRHELRPRWIRACVVGELLGFIPPAATGASLVALHAPEPLLIGGLVVAGTLEGAILGAAQARVIRTAVPGVSGWTAATATGAAIAWLAGMGGSALVGAYGVRALAAAIPAWTIGLFAMGFLQWRRLRIQVSNAARWIRVSVLAWVVGVSIPVFALSLVPNHFPPVAHVLIAIASAVAMGAVVGWMTGNTLTALVRTATEPARRDVDA